MGPSSRRNSSSDIPGERLAGHPGGAHTAVKLAVACCGAAAAEEALLAKPVLLLVVELVLMVLILVMLMLEVLMLAVLMLLALVTKPRPALLPEEVRGRWRRGDAGSCTHLIDWILEG
jgi:hypothetical protein